MLHTSTKVRNLTTKRYISHRQEKNSCQCCLWCVCAWIIYTYLIVPPWMTHWQLCVCGVTSWWRGQALTLEHSYNNLPCTKTWMCTGARTLQIMLGDMELLCLVRKCRELEETFKAHFELSAEHQHSILKSLQWRDYSSFENSIWGSLRLECWKYIMQAPPGYSINLALQLNFGGESQVKKQIHKLVNAVSIVR